jgi:predicted RNA-binding Zn-ribbon protein involved in translation (DUF1610 family)
MHILTEITSFIADESVFSSLQTGCNRYAPRKERCHLHCNKEMNGDTNMSYLPVVTRFNLYRGCLLNTVDERLRTSDNSYSSPIDFEPEDNDHGGASRSLLHAKNDGSRGSTVNAGTASTEAQVSVDFERFSSIKNNFKSSSSLLNYPQFQRNPTHDEDVSEGDEEDSGEDLTSYGKKDTISVELHSENSYERCFIVRIPRAITEQDTLALKSTLNKGLQSVMNETVDTSVTTQCLKTTTECTLKMKHQTSLRATENVCHSRAASDIQTTENVGHAARKVQSYGENVLSDSENTPATNAVCEGNTAAPRPGIMSDRGSDGVSSALRATALACRPLDGVRKRRVMHLCPHCGETFHRAWVFKGHLRVHTGERPFACPVCQRAFADRYDTPHTAGSFLQNR